MDKSDAIIDFIRARGPSLPVAIGKDVKLDTIITGAYLATLSERKQIRLSHLKVGGSPLYFLPGQEAKLAEFADRLNPVDRRTFELLKEKKVLRDRELEPVERVSLKQLRDFAVALNVKIDANFEVFWKWYLLPEDETEKIVKKILHIVEPKAEVKAEDKIVEEIIREKREAEKKAEEKKPEARPAEPAKEIPIPVRREIRNIPETHHPKPAEEIGLEERKAEEKRLGEVIRERKLEEKKLGDAIRERKAEERKVEEIKLEARPIEQIKESQRILVREPEPDDRFFGQLKEYFAKNKIEIMETSIIKKGSEIDLIIEVPSAVGRLTYYCKAKSKKRSNEGDLAAAFVQGQMKKLPVIYLTRGDLTKRATEMLSREFKGLIFRNF